MLGEFANHEEYLRYIWGRGWAFKIAAAEPSCKSLRSSGEAQPSSLVESTKSHGMKPPVSLVARVAAVLHQLAIEEQDVANRAACSLCGLGIGDVQWH